MENYDVLKLENQMCFPLYAAAREVVKRSRPHLEALGLTYTQYITMLVVWEREGLSVKEAGERLFLDSGTLTPVLKSLEEKGLVRRCRATMDERVMQIALTPAGKALRERAAGVPEKVAAGLAVTPQEAETLYRILYKILNNEEEQT